MITKTPVVLTRVEQIHVACMPRSMTFAAVNTKIRSDLERSLRSMRNMARFAKKNALSAERNENTRRSIYDQSTNLTTSSIFYHPSKTFDMIEVEVQTSMLYGIFIGARSYLIGTRFLVNKVHAETLVNKILHNRLPQELIDQVGDQLHQMNQTGILARWTAGPKLDPAEDTFYDFLSIPARHFGARPPRYPAERIVLDMMREHANIRAIWITASRPGSKNNGEPHDNKTFLHLSAFETDLRPSLAWNLPPSTSFASFATTGAVFVDKKGKVTAGIHQGQNTSHGIAIDAAVYLRNAGDATRKRRRRLPKVQTARLLQCENVEDAIRVWDAEAVKAYVNLLGLKVVPFDKGEPMKPGLHIWQRISDCMDL